MISRLPTGFAHAAHDTFDRYEKLYLPAIFVGMVKNTVTVSGMGLQKSLECFCYSELAGAGREKSLRYLRNVRDFGVARFLVATNPGETFNFAMDGQEFEIKGDGNTEYQHARSWCHAFFAGMITRTSNACEILAGTPNDVFEKASIKPRACDPAMIHFYKGLMDPSAHIAQLHIDALNKTDPGLFPQEQVDHVLMIDFPALNLYTYIFTNDEAGFNSELQYALGQHKKFWERNPDDHLGWISLPLLAACTLAMGKNFNIKVESDYIPAWLYTKDF